MKTFHFNIQSKGGAGKSMLTYLQALKEQTNEKSYFVDFDSSVKSSCQQLKFLQGKNPSRFAIMSLLDAREKLDRQLLFENLFQLSQKNYEDFYLDFGAPESDQFPALFSKDYSIEEFKQVENELNARFIFNIVIAGGSAYEPCTNYLEKITAIVKEAFEVNIYINQSSFVGTPELIEELKVFGGDKENNINAIKLFGDFDITTAPHKSILQKIGEGKGIEAYQFVEKIKIQKELSKL
jgi:cellulose biosynthesis protein BcsQ